MAIIKLNNNALTSVTALPSGVGADPNVKTDLARLGLRTFANQNLVATNSNSLSYDVFQDSTGITNLTNVTNVDEYLASVYENKVQFIPSLHKTASTAGALGTASWTGGENTANSQGNTPSGYGGTLVNELWDLSGDFQCKVYYGNSNRSGSLDSLQYTTFNIIFTTNTSLTAGSDPDIFSSASSHTNYGSSSGQWQGSNLLNSAGQTGMNVSDLSNSGKYVTFDVATNGTGAKSYDANGTTFGSFGYYNDANTFSGFKCVYDKSASTIVYQPLSWDGSSVGLPNNAITTISNVPSSGRAVILFGEAINGTKNFQTSYVNGSKTNDDFSYKTSSVVNATGSFEGATITAGSSTSEMGAVITYIDNAGVNALNSDIVLQLSADNGSNYTTATLTALPDFATGVKCCKVTGVSVIAGNQLKYKLNLANQVLTSKEARITGISLQY